MWFFIKQGQIKKKVIDKEALVFISFFYESLCFKFSKNKVKIYLHKSDSTIMWRYLLSIEYRYKYFFYHRSTSSISWRNNFSIYSGIIGKRNNLIFQIKSQVGSVKNKKQRTKNTALRSTRDHSLKTTKVPVNIDPLLKNSSSTL